MARAARSPRAHRRGKAWSRNISRSRVFMTLPVAVCGSSSTTTTSSGSIQGASVLGEEGEQRLVRRRPPRLGHDDQQRPLAPVRVRHRDHRGLGDVGMRHRGILEVDRADPLAARLDHVLAAVGDLQVAVGVDRRDVAGVEPAVRRRPRRLASSSS